MTGTVLYQADTEGFDHINAYSRSRTPLGRLLSNFAHVPMALPQDGPFASMEGYWYWLSCPPGSRNTLRVLHGWEAKQMGRALRQPGWKPLPDFQARIKEAALHKVEASPALADLLVHSGSLPIVHYYVYNGKSHFTPDPWLWKHYAKIRTVLQGWTNGDAI